jgi:PRONE (Plant-specific Rop nucleotide exchanger)
VAVAHRNRLSRPISRRSIREAASMNSVSREKVAEMQERVQVMQSCLNNFTVKRKHLGPARALELQITTLNANTFGDLKRLEPLPPKLEHMWATELEVLLSMLQEIKVSQVGRPNALREDIAQHLPALQRCDRIVRNTLRSFSELTSHVDYVDRETVDDPSKGGSRNQRRWWIKVPVVSKGGLPSEVRDLIEDAGEEMKGVFKVCHEINIDVVKSMPVPLSFVEGLPKHARLLISKELKEGLTTWGMFKVSDFMKDRGMWNREAAKDICSNLEKVALIWEARTSHQSFLSRTFDIRGERFHQAVTAFRRCQNAIRDLRREWPTMTHTDLDMAKIQGNEDIGLAGLEAYSRALESRAARLLTRIKELIDADEEARSHPRYIKRTERIPGHTG